MTFVNILIFCSPNYSAKARINTIKRKITVVDQFIILYKSIKSNWNFPYRISLCHSIEFNKVDKKRLSELDIDLYFVKADIKELPFYCRGACFNIETSIKGTHRLVLDTDMIALKNPNFDYSVDFQAMYAGSLLFSNNDIEYISKKFSLKETLINNNANGSLFKRYFNNDTNIYPYFNGGAILIKEEISCEFAKLWTPTLLLSTNKGWNDKNVAHSKKHLGCQLTIGLALLTITDNWKPFEKGFNFLGKVISADSFGKDKISLYHYCGTGGLEIAKKHFPHFFDNSL